MKSAVIYARYSCSSQTEQSIEGQLAVCNKFADANDLQIVKVYADRAMTGTNDNRPEFQQMLKDSERANWDVVLVYAIDRFGRNAIEVAVNKQKLKKNGKILISATQRTSENLDGTKNLDGIILENVYIGIAEYYSAELSQKIRRGQSESRKKGQFCGGKIPYGYYLKDKKIYIDEEKAKIVRFIFEHYSIGAIVPEIQVLLNEMGALHNGLPFNANCIYNILNNKRYSGIYELHGEIFDNIYPAIIERDVLERVQIRLKQNKVGKGTKSAPYLLKHKLYCGYCGCSMNGENGTNRQGEKLHYYKCNGKKKLRNGCTKEQIRRDRLEDLVVGATIDAIQNSNAFKKMINHLVEVQDEQNSYTTELRRLLATKTNVDNSIANVMKAIENGIITKTTSKRLTELEKEQEELEKKITYEKGKNSIMLSRDEIAKYYLDNLKKDPKIIIDNLIEKVVLYDDKMTIYFKAPNTLSPDESQGFLFYTKEYKISQKKNRFSQITYRLVQVAICI